MTPPLTDIQTHWVPLAPIFSLSSETEYDAAVARLNALVDEVGTNEQHPLYGLVDTLGAVVQNYEQQHHTIPNVPAHEVLQFLMEEHGLGADELSELGSAGDAERILKGAMELNIEQIRALASRFHVSPAVFL